MKPTDWAAILAASGAALTAVSLIIKELASGINARRTGRAQSERSRNRHMLTRLADAEAEADKESAYRRVIAEHASHLRRIALDAGVPEDALPPWPPRPS